MPSKINEWIVREYTGLLKQGEGVLVLGCEGLTVAEASALRREINGTGAELCLTRKTLANVAIKAAGIPIDLSQVPGTCALLIGNPEATIAAAKAVEKLWDKAKERKVVYRAAFFDGSQMSAAEAARIHAMPDKNSLRAMMCGAILGPARMLATALREVPASNARVLQARADKEQPAA